VVLKLNGGLGTSMGLDKAKSLLKVKGNNTFLDLTAKQVISMRKEFGFNVKFMLMNSFNTSKDTLAFLSKYPTIIGDPHLELMQNKVYEEFHLLPLFPLLPYLSLPSSLSLPLPPLLSLPPSLVASLTSLIRQVPKVDSKTFLPVDWSSNRQLEWCPPGHGDLYSALYGSGKLDALLAEGVKYMFVSNSDNLGATLDLDLLTYFAQSGMPFMMECCRRTEADKKGGHLALRSVRSILSLSPSLSLPLSLSPSPSLSLSLLLSVSLSSLSLSVSLSLSLLSVTVTLSLLRPISNSFSVSQLNVPKKMKTLSKRSLFTNISTPTTSGFVSTC
jgi:hypothetical protein